ncbi:MAG: glycosyltransferase family 4 protein [Nitrospirae bacterium]|nr:glycosyltransferase family 4 protein [Nitrospirota bacterium]
MKVAVVHDWLVIYAGAEKQLEQILRLFPDADLYSVIDFLRDDERGFILNKRANTSFIQRLPFAKTKYRNYLPLMPLAIEQLDLSGYDLIISSSYAVSKGVLTDSNQLHICYCCSPMRYAWDLYHQYLNETGLNRGVKGKIAQLILHYIRMWDFIAANRVDHFIAISKYISKRIKKVYGRDSTIIYPPVYIDEFELCAKKEDFYLTASRMVPYKRVDLIAEAFSRMPDKKLVILGDGPEMGKVKARAGKNVEILGHKTFDVLKDYMQRAKAFVFAAEEDFGITPVEAQACGTPVIAFEKGGILESVIENKTGIFFKEQTVEGLIEAVNDFEKKQDKFDYNEIRKNAERFDKERFNREFKEFVDGPLWQRGVRGDLLKIYLFKNPPSSPFAKGGI